MKLIFCMWVDTHRGTKLMLSILVGVVRHAWACLNYFKMGNQQYLKEELICEAVFLTCG